MKPPRHAPSPHPSSHRKVLLLGLCGVLLIATVGFFLQKPSTAAAQAPAKGSKAKSKFKDEDKPTIVAVATATKADFPVYLNGLGTVTALRTVTVRSRVDGPLVRVAFNEGQMVGEGDLLAEIDPRPFQIQLQQAEGQLMRDEAQLKNAEIDWARYQTLLEQDSIPAQQTATQAALVKQYRGNVEMDKAQVSNARLQLGYTQIAAPISGRVGLRLVDQGNMVHVNDSSGLVLITQLQPISVVFTLPEDQARAVVKRWNAHQPVAAMAYDRLGKTQLASGRLAAIDNQIDPATGTLKFKAQFENKDNALFANQFVNIKLHLETLYAVTRIPSAAIQYDNDGAYLYVVADNAATVRRIELGPVEGQYVAVLARLAPGEIVVVEGADDLRDGRKVEIAERDGQPVGQAAEAKSKQPTEQRD